MASLLGLPQELQLHVFEAVIDLHDLRNLLSSSRPFYDAFEKNMRSLLKTTVIPRIAAANTRAVEEALQAVCSQGNMRFKCQLEEPVDHITDAPTGALVGEWQVLDARRDIWDDASSRLQSPISVLQHLSSIVAEMNNFKNLIQSGKSERCDKANAYGDVLLQELLWDLQAYFLRCINLVDVSWRGEMWKQPQNLGNELRSVARTWYTCLTPKKKALLPVISGIAGVAERELRRHLIMLPGNSMLFYLTQGYPYNQARLEKPMSSADLMIHCVSFMDEAYRVVSRTRDSDAYEKHCRDAYIYWKAQVISKHLQFSNGRAPDRLTRIKANLASYLEKYWPMRGSPAEEAVKLIARIGCYHRLRIDQMKVDSTVAKHMRLVAVANGYGESPADLDTVTPDITESMNRVVREWVLKRSMERRYGITQRVILPGGLVFSGVA